MRAISEKVPRGIRPKRQSFEAIPVRTARVCL